MSEEKDNITFRVYQPQFLNTEDPSFNIDQITLVPNEALDMVMSIIDSSITEAPDLEKTNISLAPRRSDVDLKRIMKPEIDELIVETRTALIKMKKKMKK